MGDIKRKRRLYSRPRKLFDTDRIQEENIIVNEYGLKNKREIWKAKSVATKFRQRAKRLISKDDEEKRAFIVKLNTLGLKVENISEFAEGLNEYVEQNNSELLKQIDDKGEFDEEWEKKIEKTVKDYKSIADKGWFVEKKEEKSEDK